MPNRNSYVINFGRLASHLHLALAVLMEKNEQKKQHKWYRMTGKPRRYMKSRESSVARCKGDYFFGSPYLTICYHLILLTTFLDKLHLLCHLFCFPLEIGYISLAFVAAHTLSTIRLCPYIQLHSWTHYIALPSNWAGIVVQWVYPLSTMFTSHIVVPRSIINYSIFSSVFFF